MRTTYVFIHLDGAFVPAGRLDVHGQDVRSHAIFQYGNRYIERKNAIPVDPVMLPLPLSGQNIEIRTPENFQMFNGIRDSAPDSWGRLLINKSQPEHKFDEFDYLIGSSDTRVGALAFGPDPSKEPHPSLPWKKPKAGKKKLSISELMEYVDYAYQSDIITHDQMRAVEDGSALGGARPKFSVDSDGQLWIAKFPRKDDSYSISHAERLAMILAEKLDYVDPAVSRLYETENVVVYETARFDRISSEDNAQAVRIPFASALTMLGEHESTGHFSSYGDIADAIRRYGVDIKKDLKKLFSRMVFNVLCSNTDDHLRNHGFLYDVAGGRGWSLSPAYDVVPTPRSSHTANLTLKIGDYGKEATLLNCWSARHKFGFSDDEAHMIIEDMRSYVASSWEAIADTIGMSKGDKVRMATCFSRSMEPGWKPKATELMR
jgi:serine/threonine-protein kinase HipA